jgi:hypothetical protein
MGLLRRHQAKPMAGAANSKAAPAATPPAIAPVLVDPGLFAASKECQLVNFTMREVQIISSQKLRNLIAPYTPQIYDLGWIYTRVQGQRKLQNRTILLVESSTLDPSSSHLGPSPRHDAYASVSHQISLVPIQENTPHTLRDQS